MSISTTDIGNRALQLLGTRTTMTSLAEQSNEAQQISLVFNPIQQWCFGLSNWNFARNTAPLTVAKTAIPSGNWNNAQPSPPWLYEYSLPANFVRAMYLTNNDLNPAGTGWLGEPKRFAIAYDSIGGVGVQVVLTNETAPILIYTLAVVDPTAWPWYFERVMVYALASSVCMALVGDKKLLEELNTMLEQQINIAIQANTAEGLMFNDTTPEWTQAVGINYPFRRIVAPVPPQRQRKSQSEEG